MGDKGGKKEKNKSQKQMADKRTQKTKEKRDKQQPSTTKRTAVFTGEWLIVPDGTRVRLLGQPYGSVSEAMYEASDGALGGHREALVPVTPDLPCVHI